MAKLVLVRHGKSEWNEKGLWTGWTDVSLAQKGYEEAQKTGETLKDIHFDAAYSSEFIRTKQTLDTILKTLGQNPQIKNDKALNERNYGDFTGKNKWEIQKEIGEEEFQRIRRSWDAIPPNGESLEMVSKRAIPYFETEILPQLKDGKNILISAHGNSLRALVKHLENISDDDIQKLEIGTGEAYIFELDSDGKVLSKEIRGQNEEKGKV